MAGPILGITGAVTSWTGGNNAQLAGTGTSPMEGTIYLEGQEFDSTVFASAGYKNHIKGLQSWYVEFGTYPKAIDHGGNSAGLVTNAAGYVTNLNEWSMDIERDELESTIFTDATMSYLPGLIDWGGSYAGLLDDTTVATLPGNSSEPATGTFKYQERGAADNTLSGSIFTTRGQIGVRPSALNTISYTYRGSGALTQSTPSTGAGVFTVGAISGDAASSLVFTASTGRTFTGSAFWSRVSISLKVGQLTSVRVRARGTGALVVA